jgi:DNA replication protein DnaC
VKVNVLNTTNGLKRCKKETLENFFTNRRSLLLTGPSGTGKTVFAYSVVKECQRRGFEVPKVVIYPEFIIQLRRGFHDDMDAYGLADQIARDKRLVIIDDLGVEKATEFVREITYYIINHRDIHCLPTLITTNFDLKQIDDQLDSRLSSRLAGMCEVIKFDGEDRRLNKEANKLATSELTDEHIFDLHSQI